METLSAPIRPTPAPLWRRAFSRGTDLVCLALLVVGSLYVANKLGVERFPLNDALIFFVVFAYEVIVPAATGGLTPGRLLAGVVPTGENGGKPKFWQYGVRTVARLALFSLFAVFVAYEFDMPSFYLVCAVESLFCAFSKKRQTLGDLVARTLIVGRTPSSKAAA